MYRRGLLLASLLIGASFVVSSCSDEKPVDLPEGVQTLHGFLESTELSIKRRGTHVLKQKSEVQYFVESASVNLRLIENQYVSLEGNFEHNTNPIDLPVFVVSKVLKVEDDDREWTLSRFGISLRTPTDWIKYQQAEETHFSSSGSFAPILRIFTQPIQTIENSIPIIVDDFQAHRVFFDHSSEQHIILDREKTQLVLAFDASVHPRADELHAIWPKVLQSLRIH